MKESAILEKLTVNWVMSTGDSLSKMGAQQCLLDRAQEKDDGRRLMEKKMEKQNVEFSIKQQHKTVHLVGGHITYQKKVQRLASQTHPCRCRVHHSLAGHLVSREIGNKVTNTHVTNYPEYFQPELMSSY